MNLRYIGIIENGGSLYHEILCSRGACCFEVLIYCHHHHHHLFWKHPFLPRSARVRNMKLLHIPLNTAHSGCEPGVPCHHSLSSCTNFVFRPISKFSDDTSRSVHPPSPTKHSVDVYQQYVSRGQVGAGPPTDHDVTIYERYARGALWRIHLKSVICIRSTDFNIQYIRVTDLIFNIFMCIVHRLVECFAATIDG